MELIFDKAAQQSISSTVAKVKDTLEDKKKGTFDEIRNTYVSDFLLRSGIQTKE